MDDVTLDNLHSVVQESDLQYEDGSMADDDISGMLPLNSHLDLTNISVQSKMLNLQNFSEITPHTLKLTWGEGPKLINCWQSQIDTLWVYVSLSSPWM